MSDAFANFFTKGYHYLLILTLLLPPETSTLVYKRSWQVKLPKVRNILGLLDVNKAVGSGYGFQYQFHLLC